MNRRFLSNICLPCLIVLIFGAAPIATQADLVSIATEAEGSVLLLEDVFDLTTIGTSALMTPGVPDLLYNPATGNVQIDDDNAVILSFFLQSAFAFIPPASFSDLDNDVGAVSGATDNDTDQIGWTSAKSLFLPPVGFDGPTNANLGNIFPTGLNLAGLQGLLTGNEWSGPGGTMGSFDLVVVPEPNAFLFLLVSSTGMVLLWRCRQLLGSLFRA